MIHKRSAPFISFLLLLGVSSCGDDSDDSGSSTPPPAQQTPAQKIQEMESSGLLAKLDRTDTLQGIDADRDGIRDDIKNYIASLPYSDPQKKSLEQQAKAIQTILGVNTTDRTAMDATRFAEAAAINCVYEQFPASAGSDLAGTQSALIEEYMLNTRQRVTAYYAYSDASDGVVLPNPEGNTCE